MLIPWIPLVWGLIHVSIITSIAVGWAWLMRGKSPQLVSSLFAGFTVASLLLMLIPWIPGSQWSLLPFASTSPSNQKHPLERGLHPMDQASQAFSIEEQGRADDQATQNWFEESKEHSSPSERGALEKKDDLHFSIGFAAWLRAQIEYVEDGVRSIEKNDSSQATRTQLASFLGIGLVLAGSLWLYGFTYVRYIIRGSRTETDPRVTRLVAEGAARLNLRSSIHVRVSDQIPIGALVGWRRCYLLLHSSWQEWSEAELQAVIVHELAHAARSDFLWVVLSGLLRVVFFFHPVIHLFVRRLRFEQELAADQLAAGMLGSTKAYGRALASLALRTQKPCRTSGPMLAAGQVCILRRIAMLKHGCLRPRSLWPWSGLTTAFAVLIVVPISGLRGLSQEGKNDVAKDDATKVIATSPTEESVEPSGPLGDEERAKRKAELDALRAASEKYPPLEWRGPMVIRPGKYLKETIAPSRAWLANAISVMMLGRSLPEGAELFGTGNIKSAWTDLDRQHGRLDMGFSISLGQGVTPGVLSKFQTSPLLRKKEIGEPQNIDGRLAMGIGSVKYNHELQKTENPTQPESYIVDDPQGFFQGDDSSLKEYIAGNFNPSADVPSHLLSDYQRAGVACVFPKCHSIKADWMRFFGGSKRALEMVMVLPALEGLESVGCFLFPEQEPSLLIRATYGDSQQTDSIKGILDGLVALARVSMQGLDDPETKELVHVLATYQSSCEGRELRITFDGIPDLIMGLNGEPRCEVVRGWYSFSTAPKIQHQADGSIILSGEKLLALCSHVAQSIQAQAYRGKKIKLEADLFCRKEAYAQAGLFVLASSERGRVLREWSRSIDGSSDMAATMQYDTEPKKMDLQEGAWKHVSVELDIPEESEVLSFGFYHQQTDLQIRHVTFTVVGDGDDKGPNGKPISDFNLFAIPGVPLPSAPINLDFQSAGGSSSDEPATKVAERTDGESAANRK